MRPKVFLTRELPHEAMERLRSKVDLTWNREDRVLSKEEIIAGVRDAEGLLCLLTDAIDDDVLAAAPKLRVVSNYAVGFNNVDVDAASERGIAVTNTPGVLTDTTADMAFALLLAAARRVVEGDALVRSGEWRGWGPLQLLGMEVTGATMGLVGLGRIGRAMIPRAQGFGMQLRYWNRTRLTPDEERELGIAYGSLDEVLEASDFVSVHVAATPDTQHLLGEVALRRIGPNGVLINTARGTIVDEAALVRVLADGGLGAAGLDVFEHEPDVAPGLVDLPNVVVAPHLGSATHATRTAMGLMAVNDLVAVLEGRPPRHLVNETMRDRIGR